MPRPRSNIRERIVRAARRRFLAHGVDGATLRGIAHEARTNIGMIYYYFPTKDDLFLAVVEEVYTKIIENLQLALTADLPVRERLRRMSVYISGLSATELDVAKLMAREALGSSVRLERLLGRFRRGHLALMLTAMRDGLRSGALDPRFHPALLMMAGFALGAAPHLARRLLGDAPPFADLPRGEALAEQLMEVLFEGVGSKSSRRRRAPA